MRMAAMVKTMSKLMKSGLLKIERFIIVWFVYNAKLYKIV